MEKKKITWKEKHSILDKIAWMIYRNCECYNGEKEEDYKNKEKVYDLMCEKCRGKYNKVNNVFESKFLFSFLFCYRNFNTIKRGCSYD